MPSVTPRPRDFDSDASLLTSVLDEVIRASDGDAAIELRDRAVALGQATRAGDETAADQLGRAGRRARPRRQREVLVRSLTRWFQLVNLAEDNDRVRRIRAARRARGAGAARRFDAARRSRACTQRGVSRGRSAARCSRRAELRLVMTAHPTEARRRTTIDKLARVFGVLRELDERTSADLADARRRLLATVQELWGSDELRAISLTVLDEVRGGLVHFTTTLAETVPRVYRDLEAGARRVLPRRAVRGAAAAELRLVDRRRPRRQPVRDAADDGRRRSS